MESRAVHGQEPPQQIHHTKATTERDWLSGLIGSMADGVLAVDERGQIVLYNGAALSLLDKNGNLTGSPLQQVLQLFDKDGVQVNAQELVEAAKIPTTNRDLLLHYSDGSKANLYLSIAPVYRDYGSRGDRGFVLLLRDITREKSLEEERDEFISVVSHELRTPIAITEGNLSNAQLIAKKSGDIAEIQKALDAAYGQTLFLAGLVNDLSTLSRAERGALELVVEEIDPHKFVEDLAGGYVDQAKAKGLELKTEISPDIPTLHSCNLYIREVLHNFITNAIKYTEAGTVTISAKPYDGGIRFSVSDTGIGMSRTDQQKIFTKFFRSEDYRTRASNGTGLGLYITQKLAAMLHAEITSTSELDHGSTFILNVPDLPAS